ncbi:hypothetical protein LR48_Vigan09g083700 [Vigna angularis]|uniref:Uncharacterized protein n=1 Tax=Phaseolus angularis TaxID=3914 RepID=A0A0L9VAZ5_PHAAN|nr:hypothetical protein LR48_Vigan09g083700 [Vigna angularis]
MTRQGSERPDKGKGVSRPTKRQRQAPKYVLRVPARLPTTAPVHPSTTPAVDPSPPPAAHPSTTPAADPVPPPVIATPTPPPIVITPTPFPDPTSIPSSSSVPPSETVTPLADPDSSGDGEGLDPPLHDRPWIEPYGKGSGLHNKYHFSETFSAIYRRLLPFGKYPRMVITEGFRPSDITEGFCPSVITEGQKLSVIVSDKRFTEGFLAVDKPSVNTLYRRLMAVSEGLWPSVMPNFFVVVVAAKKLPSSERASLFSPGRACWITRGPLSLFFRTPAALRVNTSCWAVVIAAALSLDACCYN